MAKIKPEGTTEETEVSPLIDQMFEKWEVTVTSTTEFDEDKNKVSVNSFEKKGTGPLSTHSISQRHADILNEQSANNGHRYYLAK